ncbi:MAG: hypothetical protein ACUVRZ_10130 [Desulfobacca sp.]|uniref:hypothetical protein n=1 Tax=Desulfobacca sp. TaxID=2067990 RepID=UPI00404B8884
MASERHGDHDRERLSWREIDRRRDGSRHVRSEPQPRGRRQQEQEKIRREALKQAEALFAGKQQQPSYKKALAALEAQRATPAFQTAAANFLAAFDLPEDWRGLMLFLDYADPAVVHSALARLQKLAPAASMIELQGLKGKLRTLSLTSRDRQVKDQAAALLEEL